MNADFNRESPPKFLPPVPQTGDDQNDIAEFEARLGKPTPSMNHRDCGIRRLGECSAAMRGFIGELLMCTFSPNITMDMRRGLSLRKRIEILKSHFENTRRSDAPIDRALAALDYCEDADNLKDEIIRRQMTTGLPSLSEIAEAADRLADAAFQLEEAITCDLNYEPGGVVYVPVMNANVCATSRRLDRKLRYRPPRMQKIRHDRRRTAKPLGCERGSASPPML